MRPLHTGLLIALVLCGTAAPALGSVNADRPDDDSGISIERVGTWYSSTNATTFQSASDVRAGIRTENFSRARSLSGNGTLVIALEIANFGTFLANTPGGNTTERFRNGFDRYGEFDVLQLNPSASRLAIRLHVLDGPGVRVLADQANDSYYVVVNLRTVRTTYGEDDPVELDSYLYDDPYEVVLSLDSNLTETSEPTRGGAIVAARDASVDTAADDRLHVQVGRTLSVSGTTNVGTGQNLTVILRGSDDPTTDANESILRRKTITVGETTESHDYESRFRAAFAATPRLASANNLTVTVRFDGQTLLTDPVPVVVTRQEASVTVKNLTYRNGVPAVRVDTNLSAGGFLALHEGSADGPVVGHSPFLPAGTHDRLVFLSDPANVSHLVVVAHRDVNHNQWFDDSETDRRYSSGVVSDETQTVRADSPNISVENVTIWRSTKDVTTFGTADEVESSLRSGTLSRAQNLSGNGTVVIRFQMPGFDGLLARTNGTNTTRDFQQAIRRFGDLDFAQTNPHAQIAPVVFTTLDNRGIRVFGDTANDTYFMLVDLQRAGTVYESSDTTSIAPRARFTLNLTLDGSVTASGNEVVAEAYVPTHRISINQTDGFTVESGENLTVTGTANLGPFEPVQVVLRGRNDPATAANESIRRTKTVYLGGPIEVRNGTWSYTAVFERTASLRAAQNLTVRAREVDGSVTSERVPVEIVTPTPTATETTTDTATPTASARTSTASPTATPSETVSTSETVSATSSEQSSVTESESPRSSATSPSTTGPVPGFGFLTWMCTLLALLGFGRLVGAWRET